jgi:hypothetical protein
MNWRNTLRKAPVGFEELDVVNPRQVVQGDARFGKKPKGVKNIEAGRPDKITVQRPRAKEGLSGADAKAGEFIAQEFAKDLEAAFKDYIYEVGKMGTEFDGSDASGLIGEFNDLLRQAMVVEQRHKNKPFYKKIFGRGRKYRELVNKINRLGERIQSEYRNYQAQVKNASRSAQRREQMYRLNKEIGEELKQSGKVVQEALQMLQGFKEELK